MSRTTLGFPEIGCLALIAVLLVVGTSSLRHGLQKLDATEVEGALYAAAQLEAEFLSLQIGLGKLAADGSGEALGEARVQLRHLRSWASAQAEVEARSGASPELAGFVAALNAAALRLDRIGPGDPAEARAIRDALSVWEKPLARHALTEVRAVVGEMQAAVDVLGRIAAVGFVLALTAAALPVIVWRATRRGRAERREGAAR
jgi:prepilin signal peptidase PulO-like enzyme (type II secretory pathway)